MAIRHRCVEDDGGDVGEDSEESITIAATFLFSLSSSDEQLDEEVDGQQRITFGESISVSQSPTMYALLFFFFL